MARHRPSLTASTETQDNTLLWRVLSGMDRRPPHQQSHQMSWTDIAFYGETVPVLYCHLSFHF